MRRTSTKKGIDRRKRKRGRSTTVVAKSSDATVDAVPTYACQSCSTVLQKEDRALFVEEEIGRIFCSEECISAFFSPEVERLEKGYLRRSSVNDLTSEEKESFGHLRLITLQEPDEVWREKTLTGDYRYTLISEFLPSSKPIWSVCICLFLRGEPSFLFLSFVTKNPSLVNYYRKGEPVDKEVLQEGRLLQHSLKKGEVQSKLKGQSSQDDPPTQEVGPSDGLASAWTEDETYLARMNQGRSEDDIPQSEFELYQGCLEETLESPHELWTLELGQKEPIRLFHFIRHYPEEKPRGIWYVIVAKETDEEDQIEIIDAFPTRDLSLVNRYRMGEQELGIGLSDSATVTRVVH